MSLKNELTADQKAEYDRLYTHHSRHGFSPEWAHKLAMAAVRALANNQQVMK